MLYPVNLDWNRVWTTYQDSFPAFSPLMFLHPVGTGSERPVGVTSRMALGQCSEASVFLASAPGWVSLWPLGLKLGS